MLTTQLLSGSQPVGSGTQQLSVVLLWVEACDGVVCSAKIRVLPVIDITVRTRTALQRVTLVTCILLGARLRVGQKPTGLTA
jgi:hypothetical protein